MISSISNFRKLQISIFILGFFGITTFLSKYNIEVDYKQDNCPTQSCVMIEELNTEKPDLVLIGNSILDLGINVKILEKELLRIIGNPIKVKKITFDGAHTAWAYLIIKNYIYRSNLKNTPIGFFTYHYAITSPQYGVNPKNAWGLFRHITDDEEIFYKKSKSGLIRSKQAFKSEVKINSISRFLTLNWIKALHFWKGSNFHPEEILIDRFNLRNVDPFSPIRKAVRKARTSMEENNINQ